MKKSWIIIIIVFLLISNLALLGTLLIKQSREADSDKGFAGDPDNRKIGLNVNQNLTFKDMIARDLDMTEEQVEKLNSFSMVFHENKKDLGKKMDEIKHNYFSHLANENPDEVYLKNLADSLGKLLAEKMLLEYNHYKNIKSICTPEQAEKMDSLGKNRIHHKNDDQIKGHKENPDKK